MHLRVGAQEFATEECRVVISPVASSRILVVFEGRDRGNLGRQPFQALESHLAGADGVDLYFDLERAGGATLDVSSSWAQWLRANRVRLRRVSMLTGSSFVAISARTVERFAGLGNKARIYADRASFERDLSQAS